LFFSYQPARKPMRGLRGLCLHGETCSGGHDSDG
jgi:hypothetical protein